MEFNVFTSQPFYKLTLIDNVYLFLICIMPVHFTIWHSARIVYFVILGSQLC